MPERRAIAALVVAAVYYAAAAGLAFGIVSSADVVASDYAALAREKTAQAKADRLVDRVLGAITLGLWHRDDGRAGRIEATMLSAREHEHRVVLCGWGLLAVSLGFLAANAAFVRRAGAGPARLARHALGVSAVFLAVGLLAPMLTIVARGEVAVLGEVVLHYESRGVLSTVAKLYRTGNGFVAVLLFVFSIVVPFGKLALSFAALPPLPEGVRRASLRVVTVVGRWSMTDVFVVAILVAFLASEGRRLTDASLGPGLYFFAGYGLLSLAAGHLLAHAAPAPRPDWRGGAGAS